jgi:hypothetical protein
MDQQTHYPPHQQIAPPPPERKRRGCLYSCGCATIALVLLFIGLAVAAYFGFLYAVNSVSSDQPIPLPEATMAPEAQQDLNARLGAFQAALNGAAPPTSLELTSDELNTLLRTHPKAQPFGQWLYVTIEGDKISSQVSVPGDELGLPGTAGRYFNGVADLDISLTGGRLAVFLNGLTLNGTVLPESALQGISSRNLAEQVNDDADIRQRLQQLDTIAVRDGRLIIVMEGAPSPEATETPPPAEGDPAPTEEADPAPVQ